MTWAAPASVPESYLLRTSLEYCQRRLQFRPDVVIGDMGYIHQATKRELRVKAGIAMMTKLKADMRAQCDYNEEQPLRCAQGQELGWLGYDAPDQQHWFGAPAQAPLCAHCWERSSCPREFAIAADTHETFFGMIPLNTALAKRLTHSARSWIEPAQSFEKNQLGLKAMFLNSLSMAWTASLLADAAALLIRANELRKQV